jgi:hypothetical protein
MAPTGPPSSVTGELGQENGGRDRKEEDVFFFRGRRKPGDSESTGQH